MKNILVKIAVSISVSLVVFGLLYLLVKNGGGEIGPATILECIRMSVVPLVAVYGLCQIAQTLLRAVRARVLLQAGMSEAHKGMVPGLWNVALVTFVRGACADMLPARIGELSYVAMLNGGYQIPVSDCLSSLSIGLLFDFAALLIVLGVAVATVSQGLSLLGSAVVLFAVCVIGWAGLFHIMPWFAGAARKYSPRWLVRFRLYVKLLDLLCNMSDAVKLVRKSGAVLQVLGLSAAIRFVKYFGLYFLFMAVTTRMWPGLAAASVPAVLVALISAEGAASLPVPSFMSFGSYEAGGLVALTSLGFGMAESMTAMLSMHVISQIIDYGLGGLAFMAFTWGAGKAKGAESSAASRSQPVLRPAALALAGLAVFSGFVAVMFKMAGGEKTTAGASRIGVPVAVTAGVGAVAESPVFAGKIVWSSNREGSHDIYICELPSGETRRLTSSEFAETYPRFSPDGKRIAFSRSQLPYVSQRDPVKWNTWIQNLDSGKETLVATNAFTAVWDVDGESIVYVRNGTQLVRQKAIPGAEAEILFESGKGHVPEGVGFETPNIGGVDSAMAATLRGRVNGTAVFAKDGTYREIGDGCEITWQGADSATVIWMDHPGKQKNAVFSADSRHVKPSVMLDASSDYSHEYFPKTSADGIWMVFGASTGGHEHDIADYEIFLWRIGAPEGEIRRITWHTGNDCWPDLYME